MGRAVQALSVLGLGLVLFSALRLGTLERCGPLHFDLELAGRVPATFYLPETADGGAARLPPPRPIDERPPAVVLAHGLASDRVMTSSLARRLAANGYAVLALDLRGHGANRNGVPPLAGRTDVFFDDLSAAVSFLRTSPYVDGSKLVVMGHSMGATAALDFASRDSAIDGVVAISGGRLVLGPFVPPNVLFLLAERDPAPIRDGALGLARAIAADETLAPGETRGDVAEGRGVSVAEVRGADHLSVLFAAAAAGEILAWLDTVFGRAPAPDRILEDPRLTALGISLLGFLLTLPGVGWLAGRLAGPLPPRPALPALAGLAALATALAASLALVSAGAPLGFVALELGDAVGSIFFVAGAALLGGLAATGRLRCGPGARAFGAELRAALAPGLAAFGAIYVLATPIGVVAHRIVPTPERALATVVLAALVLPFFLAQETLVRRGGPLVACALGLAARLATLGVVAAGLALGVLPPVVGILLPLLAVLLFGMEVAATALYVASRSWLAIAVLESAWLAWVIAVVMPIRA
jgi:dienelactone hydrolase